MKIIISILSLVLLLDANETCYAVQLLSRTNTPKNVEILDNSNFPENCKVIEFETQLAVRCGCFNKYSVAKDNFIELDLDYPGSLIVTTYKHYFDEGTPVVAPEIQESTAVAAVAVVPVVEEATQENEETNTTQETPVVQVENEETNTTQETPIAQVEAKEPVQELPEPVVKKTNVQRVNTHNTGITLTEAIDILKTQNLEIKAATLDVSSAKAEAETVSGMNWGKLDFEQNIANSNDAGNVFGFKLTSREATFGDFGAQEYMDSGLDNDLEPQDLNYPHARNFFQSKLKYEVPLFAGFAITNYTEIMDSMTKMKSLEKEQVENEKIYQLRKSFYDMALLRASTENLNTILENIAVLEEMTKSMIDVGYAKKVDLLEVKAKKGNVQRLLLQMESNKKLLYHYLSFLLNQKVSDIQTPSSDVPIPHYSDEDILKNNLDIQKATTGLAIRKNMLHVSEAAFYPTIGAFAELATADDTFLGEAGDHKSYTVGARLTWNLFNGGIDNSKIEKSKLDHLKTKSQVELARKGITLKVAKIRTEISSSDEEIASLEKELKLADVIYANYEGRYREKLSSMSDVIIKQSEQIQKILALQVAKNKRNQKVFALEKLANGEYK